MCLIKWISTAFRVGMWLSELENLAPHQAGPAGTGRQVSGVLQAAGVALLRRGGVFASPDNLALRSRQFLDKSQ